MSGRLTVSNRPRFGVPILNLVAFGTLLIFFITYHLRDKDVEQVESPVGVGIYTIIYGALLLAITVIGSMNMVDFSKGSYSLPPFVSEI